MESSQNLNSLGLGKLLTHGFFMSTDSWLFHLHHAKYNIETRNVAARRVLELPSSSISFVSRHNSVLLRVLFNMETSYSCDAREDLDEEALLEVRIEQIAMEAELGQQRAKCSEYMIAALN
ncbi:hypothetical protein YC2023_118170 [Brassica napus]